MAFAAPDPNQVVPGQLNPAQNQAPVSAGGAGVGGAAKAASTPGQNIPAQPSAQLSAYLGANQPQAAAFAGNIANTLAGQTAAAGNAIQPAVNTYTGQQYTVPTDTTVNNAVASAPSSLTPEQQSTYKAELGAAGNAPNSANTFETTAPYQDLTQGIQGAVEQANLWNSGNNVANLSTALSPFEGQNVTQGGKTLDSLLLSQSPGAYGQIQKAVAPAANLQGYLTAGTKQANTALQNAIAQDQAATAGAQGSASQYVTGLNSNLAQYLAAAQNQVDPFNANVDKVSSNLANVQPQIAALQNAVDSYNSLAGGNPNNWGIPSVLNGVPQTFAPINLSSYLTPDAKIGAPQLGQVANAGQYSDIAALQSMLGDSGLASLNPSINSSTAGQAGTWQAPPAMPTSLDSLLSPLYNSAINGISPAINKILQYSNGSSASPSSDDVSAYLRDVIAGAGATAAGAGPIYGALAGAGLANNDPLGGSTSSAGKSANVQGNSPIGQRISGVDNAIANLVSATGKQPWPNAYHFSPTPGETTGTAPTAPTPPAVDPVTSAPITAVPGKIVVDPQTGVPYDVTTGLPVTSDVGGDIFGPVPQTPGAPRSYRPI